MGDPISALTAKMFLDGQNVFSGCDTLRIDFSKLQALNIRFNNEKSMDYTNPNLPSGDQAQSPATAGTPATTASVDQYTLNVATPTQFGKLLCVFNNSIINNCCLISGQSKRKCHNHLTACVVFCDGCPHIAYWNCAHVNSACVIRPQLFRHHCRGWT